MTAPCAGFVWWRLFQPWRWHKWGSHRIEFGGYQQTCQRCGEKWWP